MATLPNRRNVNSLVRLAACASITALGILAAAQGTMALAQLGTRTFEIMRRSDAAKGFEQLPRRWVIERTIAWLNRNRRLAKEFDATVESAQA